MNDDLDQLLARLLDGDLTESDRARLGELLIADPTARARYLRQIDLHARLTCELQGGLLIAAQPRGATTRARRWLAGPLALTAAMLIAVGAWLFVRPHGSVIAHVEQVEGEVFVQTARGKVPAQQGTPLHEGEELHTSPDSQAVLRLNDLSRLELGPDSVVQVNGRQVRLLTGELTGSAADGLVVVTPHAEARLGSGRFSSVSSTDTTHIALQDGQGAVSRTSDGQTIAMEPGNYTVVTTQPIKLAARAMSQPRSVLQAEGSIRAIAWSPDGQTFASAGPQGTVSVWDIANGRRRVLAGHAKPVVALAFSPDATLLASSGTDQLIKIWLCQTGQERLTLTGTGHQSSLAFSPDGKLLAAGGYFRIGGKRDFDIRLWDVATGKEHTLPAAIPETNVALAFTPDGATLAAVSEKGSLRLWDVATCRLRTTLIEAGPRLECLAISAPGSRLAVGGASGSIRLWDLESGKELPPLPTNGNQVIALAFSPNGQALASCDGRRSRGAFLWDLATRQEIANVRTVTKTFTSVAFSPDGKTLVTAGTDDSLRFWDVPATRLEQ